MEKRGEFKISEGTVEEFTGLTCPPMFASRQTAHVKIKPAATKDTSQRISIYK